MQYAVCEAQLYRLYTFLQSKWVCFRGNIHFLSMKPLATQPSSQNISARYNSLCVLSTFAAVSSLPTKNERSNYFIIALCMDKHIAKTEFYVALVKLYI